MIVNLSRGKVLINNPPRPFKGGRLLFLLIIPPFFFSCNSFSPLTMAGEKTPPRVTEIEKVIPRWQPLETAGRSSPDRYSEVYPRIDYYAGRIREPRLEFRALRVDLKDPRLRIVVNGLPEPGARESASALETPAAAKGRTSPPGTMLSTRVSSFVEGFNCLAGINANPFSPVSAREGEERTIVGIAVSEGVPAALPAPGFDALIFYSGGGAAIMRQEDIRDLAPIKNAVGGFNIVLQGGELPERLRNGDDPSRGPPLPRHPRSAAGLSGDGSILYLLVVDGRRPGSAGAGEAELGLLLKQLGAEDGLNFDGGGSTALALRFPDGKVRVVNTPIHNHVPGRERGVAVCLGLSFGPVPSGNPPPPPFVPGM